jgi:nicotinamidase-related amidase
LDAVDLGYFVVLARDALTSGTPEAHQAVLDVLAPRFAPQVSVMNHVELEAAWK